MSTDFRRSVEDFFALSMAKARTLDDGQVITKPVTVGYVDALLAVDSSGLPHLLAPVHQSVIEDRRSAAVWITRRELQVDGKTVIFADLGCRDQDLVRVFDRLVTEILEAATKTGERLDLVQSRTLVEWRHLLSAARSRLTNEVVTGLFGELTVLCTLASAQPHLALDAWVGPTGAVRDFAHGRRALEVKTRLGRASERVRISSLDQLDSRDLDGLLLAVIDIEDDEMGHPLGDLVDRVVELGVPRLPLLDLLAGVGYVPGMTGDEDRRMTVSRIRTWEVDEAFPALTSASLSESASTAVVGVTYSLDLTRLGAASVDDSEALLAALGWEG